MREHQALTGERRRSALVKRQGLEKELVEVKRRAMRLVDQVADGELSGAAVKDRLAQLERRRTELDAQLQDGSNEEGLVALHPAAPARYRRLVERLAQILSQPQTLELAEAKAAFRALIRSVVVKPLAERGSFDIMVETEVAPLMAGAGLTTVGAGTGFEPVTFRL